MRVATVSTIVASLAIATVESFTPSPQVRVLKRSPSSTPKNQAIAVPLTDFPPGPASNTLAPQDAWIANLDYEGFGKEVTALGKELLAQGGTDDVEHLKRMVSWRNAAAFIGLATMWMAPNPLTIVALSTWTYVSWTMIAHHTCHGGYNRVDAGSDFHSRGFALGTLLQRTKDWLDWMQPEAWNIEHNRLHHYRLNEGTDPDLVQRNLEWLRTMDVPLVVKYAAVGFFIPIWKWFYYAPNTFKELQMAEMKKDGKELPTGFDPEAAISITSLFQMGPEGDAVRKVVNPVDFFTKVVGPFFVARFVLLPAPLLLAIPFGVGPTLYGHALANLVLAELLTNIHAFITIVTNHAGEDLYTFETAVKPKTPSFYVRQIVGSANFATGTDVIDFSHGWLNYQVEHHVWPDLSMLQYRKGAPQLKAICAKYGVPYVQESVFERLRKTVDVMVGKSTMRQFPTEYEPAKDRASNGGVTWKNTNGAIDE